MHKPPRQTMHPSTLRQNLRKKLGQMTRAKSRDICRILRARGATILRHFALPAPESSSVAESSASISSLPISSTSNASASAILLKTSFPQTSRAFSLIELVFVIAVVGILAAIAIPKLSATRTDALYAALNRDIQAVISSVQVAALTQDLSAQNPDGAFIMQTAGLSASRWIAQGSGVRLGKNGALDSANNCVMIDISTQSLNIQIQPLQSSPLCQKLAKTYPNPLQINLASSIF